jgi:hypothetical protein
LACVKSSTGIEKRFEARMDTGFRSFYLKRYRKKYRVFALCPRCGINQTDPARSTQHSIPRATTTTTTTTRGRAPPPSPPGPSTSGPGLPMPGSVWGLWGSRPPSRHSYPKPRTRIPLTDQRSVWYLNPLPPLSRKGVQISHGRGFKSPNRLKPVNPLPAHSRSPFRAATQPPQVVPARPCPPYLD